MDEIYREVDDLIKLRVVMGRVSDAVAERLGSRFAVCGIVSEDGYYLSVGSLWFSPGYSSVGELLLNWREISEAAVEFYKDADLYEEE